MRRALACPRGAWSVARCGALQRTTDRFCSTGRSISTRKLPSRPPPGTSRITLPLHHVSTICPRRTTPSQAIHAITAWAFGATALMLGFSRPSLQYCTGRHGIGGRCRGGRLVGLVRPSSSCSPYRLSLGWLGRSAATGSTPRRGCAALLVGARPRRHLLRDDLGRSERRAVICRHEHV